MRHLGYIGIGAVVSLLFMVLLYGQSQVATMLFLAVVCTAGVGLIPMLFISWLVGWLVVTVWRAVADRNRTPTSAASPPTPAP